MDLWSLLIRLWTRRKGQPFADVPSHCGIAFRTAAGEWLHFEATPAGVVFEHIDTVDDLNDSLYSVRIPLEREDDAAAFATYCLGDGYDWGAVIDDALGKALPKTIPLYDDQSGRYDCSRFVLEVLRAGGIPIGLWLRPPTPNDLMGEYRRGQKCL